MKFGLFSICVGSQGQHLDYIASELNVCLMDSFNMVYIIR